MSFYFVSQNLIFRKFNQTMPVFKDNIRKTSKKKITRKIHMVFGYQGGGDSTTSPHVTRGGAGELKSSKKHYVIIEKEGYVFHKNSCMNKEI